MSQTVPRPLWRRLNDVWWSRLSDVWRTVSAGGVSTLTGTGRSGDSRGFRTDGGGPGDGESARRRDDVDHLRDVPDGAGCTEIWEHLSERQSPGVEADD